MDDNTFGYGKTKLSSIPPLWEPPRRNRKPIRTGPSPEKIGVQQIIPGKGTYHKVFPEKPESPIEKNNPSSSGLTNDQKKEKEKKIAAYGLETNHEVISELPENTIEKNNPSSSGLTNDEKKEKEKEMAAHILETSHKVISELPKNPIEKNNPSSSGLTNDQKKEKEKEMVEHVLETSHEGLTNDQKKEKEKEMAAHVLETSHKVISESPDSPIEKKDPSLIGHVTPSDNASGEVTTFSFPLVWEQARGSRKRVTTRPSTGLTNDQKKEREKDMAAHVLETYQEVISELPEHAIECRPITIFSLPRYITETNKAMHQPKLVSVGPYYLDEDGPLKTLQEHKWWCAHDFMDAHNMDPKECISKMAANESRARLCYSEEIELCSEEFIRMLLLDGCFILEFIRKHHGDILDTFFDIERNRATILTDILLMENQIPYFVIHELFNLATRNNSCSGDSCQLRDQIFGLLPPQVLWRNAQIPCDEIHHLLHFYYLCMVPDSGSGHHTLQSPSHKKTKANEKITIGGLQVDNVGKPIHYNGDEGKQLILPSVTELSEAGVRFRRKTRPRHLFDITFRNGVMELPGLFIHDLNCIMLANLVSFEQCSYGPKGIMTQFASLFANLIETEKDVAVLESSDVLINMIESKEETATFFNQLSKWNSVEHTADHKLLIKNMREYYESPWPKYRATLMRDYFNSPWAIISFIAALVLLGLAFVQTYYTAYSGIHN